MVAEAEPAPQLLGAGQDEGDATVPDLKIVLAQMKFDLQRKGTDQTTRDAVLQRAESVILEHNMTGVYEHFCSQLGWTANEAKLDEMRAANEARLKELDAKIEECGQNEGDEEVRHAMLDKADYLCNIGDKARAWEAYDAVEKKSPGANHRITIAFCKVRLEILLGNWTDVKQLLDDAKTVCDKGGDWEKKNRLMVYEGVYCLAQRQFSRAAKLFLDSMATFTTYELFDYERCIFYTVVTSIITLPRLELKKKVVDASEVLTVIHKLPGAQRLLNALYYCNYGEFFPGFLQVVAQLEADPFLAPHVRFFMREARAAAYAQYLASYKSVTIDATAAAFGVSPAFLDGEISDFIVAGRLTAKIDKVARVIETAPRFERHARYHALIKDGDLLLNRIQKLSKIVDVE